MEAFLGGLNSLSKREWVTQGSGLGLGRAWAGLGLTAQCALASSLCADSRQRPNPSASRPAPFSATARTSKSIAYSATGLIAAKPLKPCDGGVFRGAKFALKKRVDDAWVWLGRMGRMSWGLGWAGTGLGLGWVCPRNAPSQAAFAQIPGSGPTRPQAVPLRFPQPPAPRNPTLIPLSI